MASINVGNLDNMVCATEPCEDNHLASFELLDDENDELLTVDLSPAVGRKRSKSQRSGKQLAN